jgi:hypothetical protein
LFAALFPAVDRYIDAHPGSLVEALLVEGLRNTDRRIEDDKPVTPTFLFALLLYGPIAAIIEALPPERWHEHGRRSSMPATRRCAKRSSASRFRGASRLACARCTRCSRGSKDRAAGAHCGCSSNHGSAPPTTC